MKHVAASLRLVLGPCPRSALSWAGRGTPSRALPPARFLSVEIDILERDRRCRRQLRSRMSTSMTRRGWGY